MPRTKDGGGFSGPLSVIAVVSIALGVLVMVMAVCILRGFQGEIASKVVGFGSHLTVSNFASSPAYQEEPIVLDSTLVERIQRVPGVRHIQYFATKGGMVKTADQIYGIMFRGLSADYDTTFFASNLVEGRLPVFSGASGFSGTSGETGTSTDVLVSSTIASRLRLKVGDKMRTYFWGGDTPRSRAFTVCGIYNTDLTEFDELYVVGDLRQVQRLNEWETNQVGGYEVLVDNFDRLDDIARNVERELPYDYSVQTIREANPALFAWLDLLNSNITLILVIMSLVCAVAIVSALLIMIFEKGRTIGLLKALGATNASVRRIFLIKASRLIAEGILIGDAVALALCVVQQQWQVVKLDAESYSMTHVPVDIDPMIFLLVSLGTLVACLLALLLPAAYISHITPAQAVKIEN
ncbi:MAG: ABC transporter permease [Bacteroidales bacterium]|nr:ABC transporter permease [Bacteroidales bacterium]